MGAFFTNYQVRSDSAAKVATEVRRWAKNRAFVSDAKNGWVTLYEEASDKQDVERLQQLAHDLSGHLETAVFAFLVHDSDVLLYWLYEAGKLSDHYNSRPDYFAAAGEKVAATTWQRLGGNPAALRRLCRPGTRVQTLEKILHRVPLSGEDFLNSAKRKKKLAFDFEEQRLRELACVLGLDEHRACLGFHDLERGGAGNRKDFRLVRNNPGKNETVAK